MQKTLFTDINRSTPTYDMESNFTSVVRFAPLGRWPKIDDDGPSAQLHAKFWGISMLHEEQEWRNSQQPIPAVRDELETGSHGYGF